MKNLLILLLCVQLHAQKNWFTTYQDSTALVQDAQLITLQFTNDLKKINPKLVFQVKAILHTTPYLIYYDGATQPATANLPLWSQVILPQQKFFAEVAGSEAEGQKAFGYFFNGFYLPHELGHAIQEKTEGNLPGSYASEYFANTIAILWWKKKGDAQALKDCYQSAKTMWQKLPNPVPAGTTIEEYFSKNYEQATQDPYVYGYMQFKQFMLIYEDPNLPDFDRFVKAYLEKHLK